MAARYLVATGDWSDTACWSASSGGASGASVPGASDAVIFDTNSGSHIITVNTSTRSCLSLTVTSGFTGTLRMNTTLQCASSITLGANMAIDTTAGTPMLTLTANTAYSMTSNGKAWPFAVTINASAVIITVVDDWTFQGLVTQAATTQNTTWNGGKFYCEAGVTFNKVNANIQGTTVWVVKNGTITCTGFTSGGITATIEVDAGANTVTLNTGANTMRFTTGGVLKFTSGTFVSTAGKVTLLGNATITCNASGFSLNTIFITAGNQTFNGTHGFTIANWSQLVAGLTHTFTSGNTYSITSSFIVTATSASKCTFAASTGSSAFYLNYSGSTLALAYLNATDVDSSGGSAISVYSGTLTRTTNWTNLTQIGSGGGSTHAYSFIS